MNKLVLSFILILASLLSVKAHAIDHDRIQNFLKNNSPAYNIAASSTELTINLCKNSEACTDYIPSKSDLISISKNSVKSFAKELPAQVSTDIIDFANDPEFIYKSTNFFFQKFGKPQSHAAFNGLRKIQKIAKKTRHLGKALTALNVIKGGLKTYNHIRSNDYKSATKQALKTGTKLALAIKKAGMYGAIGAAVCTAIAVGTAGIGGVACVAGMTIIAGAVGDAVIDKTIDMGVDASAYAMRKGTEFTKETIIPTIKNQIGESNYNTLKSNGDRYCSASGKCSLLRFAGSKLFLNTHSSNNAPYSTMNNPSRTAIAILRSSPNTGRIKDFESHTIVNGNVVTTSNQGTAITRIGSAIDPTKHSSTKLVTRIDGSVVNSGGVIDINSSTSCNIKRNGQCCISIKESKCVISKYTLKKLTSSCSKGYKKKGKECLRFSDDEHSISR